MFNRPKHYDFRVICIAASPTGYLCPERHGWFKHPTDCNSYYICENNVPEAKKCPPGLDFNQKTKLCDLPHRARCRSVTPA